MKSLILPLCVWVGCLTPQAFGKRAAPDPVPPVRDADTVYTAPHFSPAKDGSSRGGIVEARDATTHKLRWQVTVYQTQSDPGLEQDVQDVFIKTLTLDKTHRLLVLSDERGRVFAIDLDNRKVTTIRDGTPEKKPDPKTPT